MESIVVCSSQGPRLHVHPGDPIVGEPCSCWPEPVSIFLLVSTLHFPAHPHQQGGHHVSRFPMRKWVGLMRASASPGLRMKDAVHTWSPWQPYTPCWREPSSLEEEGKTRWMQRDSETHLPQALVWREWSLTSQPLLCWHTLLQ